MSDNYWFGFIFYFVTLTIVYHLFIWAIGAPIESIARSYKSCCRKRESKIYRRAMKR